MSKGLSTVRTNAILFWTLLCLLVLFGAWVRAETVYSEADVTPGFSDVHVVSMFFTFLLYFWTPGPI